MRLILSGGGDPENVILLDEIFINQIDLQKTVLYIPVAMETHKFSYDECFEWIKKTYRPYGVKNIEMCTNLNSAELDDRYTAVYIGGGNTY